LIISIGDVHTNHNQQRSGGESNVSKELEEMKDAVLCRAWPNKGGAHEFEK
jgi:hypothetical protein